ncbi:MAG: hypothetical protein V3S24_09510 [Candidatus Tectomicrobia bacterium]
MEKDDLHRHLGSLREDFSHLGTQLASVSERLQNSGVLPPKALIEGLATARSDFEVFQSRILAVAQSLELQSIPEPDDLASLVDLESLLHTVVQAKEEREETEKIRQGALTVLDRVFIIDHRDSGQFAPLIDIHKKAHDLRDAVSNCRWTDLHPDTQVLADGHHAFSALLSLAELPEELDDDQWARLQGIVAQSFGKPMSVAAARGKLFLTVPQEEEGTPTIATLQEPDRGGSQVDQAKTPVGLRRHPELLEETTDTITGLQHTLEGEVQYDIHTMEQADLERFLNEQLRSVRKEVSTHREIEKKQERIFMKSLRQRLS